MVGSLQSMFFYDLCFVEVLFCFLVLPRRKTELSCMSHGSMKEEKEKRYGGSSASFRGGCIAHLAPLLATQRSILIAGSLFLPVEVKARRPSVPGKQPPLLLIQA